MLRKIKQCKGLAIEYSKQMKRLERPWDKNECGFFLFLPF